MSTKHAAATASPSRRSSSGTSGSARSDLARARTSSASTVAPASSAIESRRCSITIGQRRSLATASSRSGPAGACRGRSPARAAAPAGSPGVRRAASQAISVERDRHTRRRAGCRTRRTRARPSPGSGWPSSQPGQWRQPSPESVSRTAAPVPTISQSAPSSASRRKRQEPGRSDGEPRRRASAVGCAFSERCPVTRI